MSRQSSFFSLRLFWYIFFFVLFTLHSPYIFLIVHEDMILLPDGQLDYDMGGIFPFLGAAMIAVFYQTLASIIIFVLVTMLKYFRRNTNSLLVSLLAIAGLQIVVYLKIYYGNINAEIVKAFGPFTWSIVFLAVFVVLSLKSLQNQNISDENSGLSENEMQTVDLKE